MSETPTMTFWDHLDELRSVIIRTVVVTVVAAAVAFCLKEQLFEIVLAPRTSDFITYRLFGVEPFSIHLMNTGLTEHRTDGTVHDSSEDSDVCRCARGLALYCLSAFRICLASAL